MTHHSVELEVGGRILRIETGKMARQASGSAVVRCGDTLVLVAAVAQEIVKDLGFFPLTIDYRERTSAAGKFPGGFFKREGRPTTKEIITMRLIDRPVRPLFPEYWKTHEVQIQATVLAADQEVDPDICAMVGASAALAVSDIPFQGPLGAVRIGRIGGQLVVNPSSSQQVESDLDLVVAGTAEALTMVEAGAKEVPESVVLDALDLAHAEIRRICAAQKELAAKVGVEKLPIPKAPEGYEELFAAADRKYFTEMRQRIQSPNKKERRKSMKEIKTLYKTYFGPNPDTGEAKYTDAVIALVWENLEYKVLRDIVVKDHVRVDGRKMEEIRPIEAEVNVLPRNHGSSLFTRGETQALVSVTLGTTRDEQKIDGLHEAYSKAFMLHYNFPPFSVGECRPIRGPGRREIGHGMLAERALEAVLPAGWPFPYPIRIVSDILESNGSSSMATVCGGTLALMDAAVPLKAPVAGIAMGLVKEGDEVRILSDILGDEDHLGDMDFKVAGTEKGMTSMQMDCKIAGVGRDIMARALDQAKRGRMHILVQMAKAIAKPRKEISIFAPSAYKIQIDPSKIGLIVGTGGRTIKAIQAETGAQIEIEDTGFVSIYCIEKAGAEAAKRRIESMTEEPEIGRIYQGTVTGIKPFGAFVEFLPGQEGMVHVSELADGFVNNVRDVVKEGDPVYVKVLSVDRDRIRLSKKAADEEMAPKASV